MASLETTDEDEDCDNDEIGEKHNEADDPASAKEHLSRGLQIGLIRIDGNLNRGNRDSEQTAQEPALYRFELKAKLVKPAREQRIDEIILSKNQCSHEMVMRN